MELHKRLDWSVRVAHSLSFFVLHSGRTQPAAMKRKQAASSSVQNGKRRLQVLEEGSREEEKQEYRPLESLPDSLVCMVLHASLQTLGKELELACEHEVDACVFFHAWLSPVC